MRIFHRHHVIPLLLAALALALVAAPAQAQTRKFKDPARDVPDDSLVNIGTMVVQFTPAALRVRLFAPKSRPDAHTASDGVTDVWINTDAHRDGPEWGAVASWETGDVQIYRAYRDRKGFHLRGRPVADCTVRSATYDASAGSSQVVVPRRCLGGAKQAGVNVVVYDESGHELETAQSVQYFTPFVHVH